MPDQSKQFARQKIRDLMEYFLDVSGEFEQDFKNFEKLKKSIFFVMLSDTAAERVTSIFNTGSFSFGMTTNTINSTVLSRHVKICYEFSSVNIGHVKLVVRYFDPNTEIMYDGKRNWAHFKGPTSR